MGTEDDSMIICLKFSNFSMKIYVVTPHKNRLDETVLMSGHNICFCGKIDSLIIHPTSSYLEQ